MSIADTARIFQINVSPGGVPKTGVHSAQVEENGIVVDIQRNKVHHGGPERALCLYRLESIRALQEEGHPIFPGSVGENITTIGLRPEDLVPGVRLALGPNVVVELTSYTVPCTTIVRSFSDGNFNRISEKKHPGWSRIYARIIEGGEIRTGDEIRVLQRS